MRDDLDRRIVRELQRNARAATSTIAARLGVARSTVHERVSRMERDGTIAGYSVVLTHNPAEERIEVLMLLEIRQQETRKILKKLESYTEVRLILSINGEYDLFVSAQAPRIEDLDVFVDEVAEIPGILRTNTSVVFGRKLDRSYDEAAQAVSRHLLSKDRDFGG
ncbi:Lrp/AsnC family transcriptional regulator [Pelagivirga sediminicola]|uniref:Lrp/AsnC family transcriptional regulator n=1 Tax=Pelagivirga sediminicola TaxID=2170575 RepID=A0A2T7G7A6_9RHOB|nr:Lrp/AsnC family transcriptional regulator [Pelagivirga sediminicola]PVA10315.1 Lrp/AsnC family transcriptional regulator [Pelagivirga sediminicola]